MTRRASIIIHRHKADGGPCRVDGYTLDGANGLAVTPATQRIGGWSLTHVGSGKALPIWFCQAVDAARFALLCAKRCTWSRVQAESGAIKIAFVAALDEFRSKVPEYYEGHTYGREMKHELAPTRWYTIRTTL